MDLVVPAEAGTQNGLSWIPAFAGKTRVILLEALIKDGQEMQQECPKGRKRGS